MTDLGIKEIIIGYVGCNMKKYYSFPKKISKC